MPRTPYATQALLLLRATLMGRGEDLVFQHHGQPLHRTYIRRRWFSALGVAPERLRQSRVPLLLFACVPPKDVQSHIGWPELPPGFRSELPQELARRSITDTVAELERRLGFSL